VASEEGNSEDQAGATHEPRECMACRGGGRVISNLGGTPNEVVCPWCDGTGVRVPGIDAQARWREQQAAEDSPRDESSAEEPPAEGSRVEESSAEGSSVKGSVAEPSNSDPVPPAA
jgi:hypothetical protein